MGRGNIVSKNNTASIASITNTRDSIRSTGAGSFMIIEKPPSDTIKDVNLGSWQPCAKKIPDDTVDNTSYNHQNSERLNPQSHKLDHFAHFFTSEIRMRVLRSIDTQTNLKGLGSDSVFGLEPHIV
jgi:hypothetical protein